jgi:hypothetical protein
MDDAADELLHGLSVCHSEKLADLDCQGQLYERPVGVDNESLRFLRGHIRSGSFSEHYNREREADTLAPA